MYDLGGGGVWAPGAPWGAFSHFCRIMGGRFMCLGFGPPSTHTRSETRTDVGSEGAAKAIQASGGRGGQSKPAQEPPQMFRAEMEIR